MNQAKPSLRALVYEPKTAGKSQNFQFSFGDEHEEDGEVDIVPLWNLNTTTTAIKPAPISESASLSENPINDLLSTKFFFYNREALNHKRSIYSTILPFTKRVHTLALNQDEVAEKKRELTEEFKKKHKSASKRRLKMRRLTATIP